MKPRILFLSNLYPNSLYPNQAMFNYQQVEALSSLFDVAVLSPVPWVHRLAVKADTRPQDNRLSSAFPVYWYTPGIMRPLYGKMMLASVSATAEIMHRKRPFDLVLGAWLYPDGWAAGKLAERWGVPFYLKVHGTDVNRLSPNEPLTKVSLQAIGRARGVICVSQALKNRLGDLGVPVEKCHVVYNGINDQIFYPRDRAECRQVLGLETGERLILYVGNLLKTKGLDELAVAFARIARVSSNERLVVIGAGPWKGSLRDRIAREGVAERVFFAGSVRHQEIAIWMNAADVLCLPSYMEGVPNVILESLACNTPVVATAVGGVPELAREDDRITLVAPRDACGLGSALEKVLQGYGAGAKKIHIQSWNENAARVASIILKF